LLDIHTHHGEHGREKTPDVFAIKNVRLGLENEPVSGWFSVGLHPWDIEQLAPAQDDFSEKLAALAAHPRCKAIGEAGLDTLVATPMARQIQVFEQHISLAISLHKPLIVHCVRAHNELIALLKRFPKPLPPIILHGYNNNVPIAEQLLRHGCYLSFGQALLRENSPAQAALAFCPVNRLFLETDNADISIRGIYAAAAQLLGMGVEEVLGNVKGNWSVTNGDNGDK